MTVKLVPTPLMSDGWIDPRGTMGEFVLSRLRSKFLRRSSTSSVKIPTSPSTSETGHDTTLSGQGEFDTTRIYSSAPTTPVLRGRRNSSTRSTGTLDRSSSPRPKRLQKNKSRPTSEQRSIESSKTNREAIQRKADEISGKQNLPPRLTLQEPTPEQPTLTPLNQKREVNVIEEEFEDAVESINQEARPENRPSTATSQPLSQPERPPLVDRQQSIISVGQQGFIQSLLSSDRPASQSATLQYLSGAAPSVNGGMLKRKIWVKRPGASATRVPVTEDDVVDDVREAILKKYGNSLGRNLDAPDITLRIVSRDPNGVTERILGPEEQICQTLDTYYPGSQSVDEALIIEVPQRRTPRPSPRYGFSMPPHMTEEYRPGEGTEYFPPMPTIPSPHLPQPNQSNATAHQQIHAMSVLSTGQVPALPSAGGRTYRQHGQGSHHGSRPRYGRNHTSSPTVISSLSANQQVIGIVTSSSSIN